MSIEIKIPKEINRYEAKAVGPFTFRQLISLVVCMPFCVGFYVLLSPVIGTDLAGFVAMIPGGVAYCFGWYKPYGMKFEVYMKSAFVNSFLAPSKRLYKTENLYTDILSEVQMDVDSEALVTPDGKKKAVRKQKYKKSKLAIK